MTALSRIAELADEIAACGKSARLLMAQKLAEARKISDEAGLVWADVLAKEIRPKLKLAIGDREVRRLIEIGSAPDPQQALETERAATRERVAKITAGRSTSIERNMPPLQKALAAVNALPPEERRQVVEIAAHEPRKAAVTVSPRDALIRAIDAVDDDTFLDVIVTHAWSRLGMVLRRTEPLPAHDPVTGEILEERGQETDDPAAHDAAVPVGMRSPASIPPAGLADGDFFEIPAVCDRRGQA